MATWWHKTKTTLTEEWVVPNGYYNQLDQAIHQAKIACAKQRGCEINQLPDSAVEFRGADDGVVIYFSYEAPECHC